MPGARHTAGAQRFSVTARLAITGKYVRMRDAGVPPPAAMPGRQTILTLNSGSLSMWQAITSPGTTGPTFSGVPE